MGRNAPREASIERDQQHPGGCHRLDTGGDGNLWNFLLNAAVPNPFARDMLPESFAPSPESLAPTSARISIAARSDVRPTLVMAARTDKGRARAHNEDNFLIDPELGLAVVCDGMGGHAAGAVASALAVRAFRDALLASKQTLRDYIECENAPVQVTRHDVASLLQLAANAASQVVHREASQDPAKRGMGTTLVAVLVLNNHAFVVNVGDSRAYISRQGELEQLTRDHNVYNELIRCRKLPAAPETQVAPKNALTRAVGIYEHCEAETLVIDVAEGDRILLCSDGLYRYFEGGEGSTDELRVALFGDDGQHVVDALIERANELGGKDNITAVSLTLGHAGDYDSRVLASLSAKRRALAESRLFALLDERELLRVLALTEVQSFYPDAVIIEQDTVGGEMYLVLSGTVGVYRAEAMVRELHAGEHFGEMALLRNRPRSAHARAITMTELLVISRESFYDLLRSEHELGMKLLWQFTGVLADRLAETTRDLSRSREERESPDLSHEVCNDEEEDARITLRPAAYLP
jgi:serine/threonine protein phosphatase PrpC/CRP-like cAMP-binding protein